MPFSASGVLLTLAWHATGAARRAPAGSAAAGAARAGARLCIAPATPPPPPPAALARALVACRAPDGAIVVTGATFTVKEGLKALRFRWRPAERAWAWSWEPRAAGALGAADEAVAATTAAADVLRRLGELAVGAQLSLVQPPGPAATAVVDVAATPSPPPPPSPPAGLIRAAPPAVRVPVPAEPARLPAALSVSAIDAWRQCALLFRFRYVDRLRTPPTPDMFVGIAAHAALQRLFEAPPTARTRASLGAHLDGEWAAMLRDASLAAAFAPLDAASAAFAPPVDPQRPDPTDVPAWRERAHHFVEAYMQLEAPEAVSPLALERKLLVQLGGGAGGGAGGGTGWDEGRGGAGGGAPVAFTGVLDRVDRAASASGGGVTIVDYKTGKAPSETYGDATNARIREETFFQLRVYALLVARSAEAGLGGEVPTTLRLLFLNGPAELVRPFDASELGATEAELLAVAAEIRAAASAHDFAPRPGRLCDWCAFKSTCPAFVPGLVLGPPATAGARAALKVRAR
ncbi:hypothetical protein KFE25_013245 [Diacronema lutheri]|uniref:PD-(D/E)XK endonuclease-like domain-containing protein n=1 Tax=Diacronema lutheri TaxID=2081491 RepID=A0A8J5X4Q7_DIALT|nr:hypothetical protein KFE25_013245 [Diacronema lutheri]